MEGACSRIGIPHLKYLTLAICIRFEDPYRSKVQCWLKQSDLFIRPLGLDRLPVPGSIPEKIDLRESKVSNILWAENSLCQPYVAQVERDEKGKFSIVRRGQVPLKLKADSVQESEEWISRITSAAQQVILDSFSSRPLQNKTILRATFRHSMQRGRVLHQPRRSHSAPSLSIQHRPSAPTTTRPVLPEAAERT